MLFSYFSSDILFSIMNKYGSPEVPITSTNMQTFMKDHKSSWKMFFKELKTKFKKPKPNYKKMKPNKNNIFIKLN